MTYRVELTRRARRSLSEELPEVVAAACWEFIRGPLAENPHRVGKRLREELADRWSARCGDFRVVYEIHEDVVVVRVIDVRHRRDVYR
ncbi:type II toxin-antitoxin system RelE family toxin [Mycobacterium sp. NPDC003449]